MILSIIDVYYVTFDSNEYQRTIIFLLKKKLTLSIMLLSNFKTKALLIFE